MIINENLEGLFSELQQTYNPDHDYILINDQGDYLKHPNPKKSFAFEFGRHANAFDDFPELKDLFLKTDPATARRSIIAPHKAGALVAISFAYNPLDSAQKIGIIALGKREQIESTANQALRESLVLIALMMLIAIGIGLWLMKRIRHPFEDILVAIKDYDIPATLKDLPTSNQGPAGVIAKAFQGYLLEIQSKTDQLLEEIQGRIQAQEDLNEVNRALFKANSELEQFAYIASHDLKAPLRVIANTSSWLLEDLADKLSEENLSNLKMVKQRAQRMENMLTDLFEYLRAGHPEETISTESVSAGSLINEVLYILNPSDRYTITCQGDLACSVPKLPIRHVLLNLIDNAIRHNTSENPRVIIDVKQTADDYQFSIKDNGPGIEAAYRDDIFKPFTTLRPRDVTEGTGLGLTIALKVTKTHGGEIHLESEPGKGSTFTLHWPR